MTQKDEKTRNANGQKLTIRNRSVLRSLYPLSGKEVLNRVLDHESPRQLIQQLPYDDFFWLVKKVGDDDCLPLLALASEDQWQYLLDLEVWRKDALDVERATLWIGRLQKADRKRLVRWFYGDGETIAWYHLFRSVQLEVRTADEIYDLPNGFFSVDGIFYVRVLDKKQRDTIEELLRTMASEDHERYQALLLGISGVVPAELEEEMYRMRNVRLAEHGFLPFEQALSVYAPLDPGRLRSEESVEMRSQDFSHEDKLELAPISPLHHAGGQNILALASSRITDNYMLDRIYLEFAGLCNQIFSADGLEYHELEALITTSRKAAGCLNIALEKLCGSDISSAEKLLRTNSLVSIFRVGFGLVLRLKWEIEHWLEESWFCAVGLDLSFWGDDWAETLEGLLKKKPRLYVAFEAGEEYKDFESLSELDYCGRVLNRVKVLDKLLEKLAAVYPLDTKINDDFQLTFRPLLFTLFASSLLKLEISPLGISPDQMKQLIGYLRAGETKPPYQMAGFEEVFVRDFMAYASDLKPDDRATLKDTLHVIWQEFREEFQWIATGDLDKKFANFF